MKRIETLNKIVKLDTTHDELLSTLVCLFLQSPRTMVREVLCIALANGKQTQVMVEILCHTSPICNVAVPEPWLPPSGNWTLLHDLVNTIVGRNKWKLQEVNNCSHLITSLINNSLLDCHIFLTRCLLPTLQTCLRGQQWDLAKMWLETLNVLLRREDEHHLNLAVILLLLAQIVNLVSYSITTFQPALVSVRVVTLEVVGVTLHRFLKTKSTQEKDVHILDKEVKWLQINIMKTILPRNRCYFNKLWSHFDVSQPLPADRLLALFYQSHCGIHWEATDITTSFIMAHLVKVLPTCTSKEWVSLALHIKDHLLRTSKDQADLYMILFLQSICIICHVHSDTHSSAIMASLDYCFRNLALLVKDLMIPELELIGYKGALSVFHSLTYIYDILPEQTMASCSVLFCEILKKLEELVVKLASNVGKINDNSIVRARCDTARYLATINLHLVGVHTYT